MNRQDATTAKRTEPSGALDELARAVISAAIEVHRMLGPGFLESVHEKALCVELSLLGIPFLRQVVVAVDYKEHPIGESRLLDLLVGGSLVVELKAADALVSVHSAQLISYLRATGHHLGLLINSTSRFSKRATGGSFSRSSYNLALLAPWRFV